MNHVKMKFFIRNYLRFFYALSICCALSSGLSGCGSVTVPSMAIYTLTPPAPLLNSTHEQDNSWYLSQAKLKNNQSSILITTPHLAAAIATNQMAYYIAPSQWHYFTRHRWASTPGEMLLPLMVNALQNSTVNAVIVGAPFTGLTHWRLDSHLMHFEQRFDERGNSVFYAELQVVLIEVATGKIKASQTLIAGIPVRGNNINQAMVSANVATGALLSQLKQFWQTVSLH